MTDHSIPIGRSTNTGSTDPDSGRSKNGMSGVSVSVFAEYVGTPQLQTLEAQTHTQDDQAMVSLGVSFLSAPGRDTSIADTGMTVTDPYSG